MRWLLQLQACSQWDTMLLSARAYSRIRAKVSGWFEHPSRPKCEELPSLEFCTAMKASTEPSNTSKHIASHRSPWLMLQLR